MNSSSTLARQYRETLKASKEQELIDEFEIMLRKSQKAYWTLTTNIENRDQIKNSAETLTYIQTYIEMTKAELEDESSLKKLESVKAGSHIHNMGGGQIMKNEQEVLQIKNMLKKKSYVDKVYLVSPENQYVIVIAEDDPDLTLELFELYWDLFDQIGLEYEFEFKPVFVGNFNLSKLPESAQLVVGG